MHRFLLSCAPVGALLLSFSATAAAAVNSFDDVTTWVGTGGKQAVLVVDWNDGSATESLAWGFRWDGQATGETMLRAVVGSPVSGLYARVGDAGALGMNLFGLGLDVDGDGFGVTPTATFTNGVATATSATADGVTASDPDDRYRGGWLTDGFWAYYNAAVDSEVAPSGAGWVEQFAGLSSRVLADGSWDGLSFAAPPDWAFTVPSDAEAAAAVPEPAVVGSLFVLAGLSLLGRRRREAAVASKAIVAVVVGGAVVVGSVESADAAVFAGTVVNYQSGALSPANYNQPATALGKPNPTSGWYALSPYNAAFANTDMVGIGAGGSLTLQFASAVPVGAGREFGVHAGVNLFGDADGTSTSPALTFNDRRAVVEVSQDGTTFVALNGGGVTTFNLPTNFYADLAGPPGTQSTGGDVEADFGKPFNGTLADFSGLSWTQAKALLDGSAGGTWFDASGLGLSELNYVRFSVPTGATYRMFVDAVAAVPEPSGVALAAVGLLALARRRRV